VNSSNSYPPYGGNSSEHPGEKRPETVNGGGGEKKEGRMPHFFIPTGPPAIFFRSLFGFVEEIN
jgi:hypothetical protein